MMGGVLVLLLLGFCATGNSNEPGESKEIEKGNSPDAKDAANTTDLQNQSQNGAEGQNASAVTTSSNTTSPNYKHVKFDDDWPGMYPDCSPEKNKYLSPVNLDVKKAIEVGHHQIRTLLLYAFEPIKNYSLQTWYNDTENKITMSALTITLDDTIFFEGTYINGLGFEEFKLFRHAVFFMSKKGLRPAQSHHQINGQSYPMEIMMTFTNRKPDNNTLKNTTQVFILVEIQKYDNPNFFPVIEAAKQILKMKSKSDIIKNLTATLEILTKNLTNVTEAYMKSGKGGDVEKLKSLLPQIGHAMRQMKVNSRYKMGIEEVLNQTNQELAAHDYVKDYEKATQEFKTSMKDEETVAQGLISKPNDLALQDQKEVLDSLVEVNRRRLGGFGHFIGSLMHRQEGYKSTTAELDKENEQIKAFLEGIQNEIQGDKPENGTMLLAFIKTQMKRKEQIAKLQDKINATKAELAKTEKSLGWKQRMGVFQVTWLLPDHGGIYTYNGSNPLPPCHRHRYSVVLKNPVGISQGQFDILSSIPAYEGQEQVADQVAPRLSELGQRLVWSNAKNIQWMRDDGIHMKSIIRAQVKKELKEHKKKTG